MSQESTPQAAAVIAACKKLVAQGQVAAAVSQYRLTFNCSRDEAMKALGLK